VLHCRCQDVDFEAQGLTENKEYLFRVAAANANGTGDWLEMPSPIVAKMPFGKRPHVLPESLRFRYEQLHFRMYFLVVSKVQNVMIV